MSRIDGILLLDKPAGVSSNGALQQVKRALGADKAGHTGSLDPLATGMLPICLGEATKASGHLLGARKCYLATVALGATTTTADADGEVLERRPVPPLERAGVEALLARFVGRITQRPPAYSAIKRDGVPLYRLARRGVAVEAPLREVVIESIALLALEPGRLEVRVVCGSGTYIRSLATDLGEALGCGAHLSALRREWVEPFAGSPMVTIDELLAAPPGEMPGLLLPVEAGLASLPRVDFAQAEAALLCNGITQSRPDLPWRGAGRAHGPEGRLLALVEVDAAGVVRPRRVFVGG